MLFHFIVINGKLLWKSSTQAESTAIGAALKSIELFAGAGGLAIATSRAGFDHEAVIEWDHDACDTLRLNARSGSGHAGDWSVVEGDISAHDFRQYRDRVEFVSGGPPCQPFSMGGKHGGNKDKRNIFPQAVRSIHEIRPKAFIFENMERWREKLASGLDDNF